MPSTAYRRGDWRAALAEMDQAGELGLFGGPALVAMGQAELGDQSEAHRALERAVALDPMLATDPRRGFRLLCVRDGLIGKFMDGLRKAGLGQPGL